MSYFTQFTQNVVVSAVNSSTANLAGGATFTGTSQSTLGVNAIQVNIKADQNCTVYVDQSIDGTNWDITDSFNYYSALGGNSWTVVATASYCRVRVTNLNASTATTVFRLQTELCPMADATPRATSDEGNLKVGVYELECGTFDVPADVSPGHSLSVEQNNLLVGPAFPPGNLDPNFWSTTTATGTASATVSGSVVTLATNPTGSASGSSIVVNSFRTARFIPTLPNFFKGKALLPIVTGINTRRWGAYNATNGYFFSHNGTTLSIGCRTGGVDTLVASGSFNGLIGSTYVVDHNIHDWEIFWIIDQVWFRVDGKLLHTVQSTTVPPVGTPHLQVGMECTNGANTNNNTLQVWIASILRMGQLTTQTAYKHISTATTTICKYGPGAIHSITINSAGGSSNLATIYDNTAGSGSVMAVIQTGGTGIAVPVVLQFDGVEFNTGLTIVTSGSASQADITVAYE